MLCVCLTHYKKKQICNLNHYHVIVELKIGFKSNNKICLTNLACFRFIVEIIHIL